MSKLKDIVEQVQETPSPRCWESIASQLLAAGTAIGETAAATATKGTMAVGKLAAIIGSAAAVITVVTIATVSLLKNDSATDNQLTANNSTQISVSDSISTENTDTHLVDNESAAQTPAQSTILADNSNDKEAPVVTSTTNSVNTAETTPTPSQTVSTTSVTPTNTAVNPASTSSSGTTANTQSTPTQNNTASVNVQTKPTEKAEDNTNNVTESHPETSINPEDFGYSRPVVIEIPNIFTPNGDGKNEHFVINGLEQCDKRMLMVKDQKGQTVFQSNRYDNSWDGANLPDGTYYYQFMYSINNLNEVRKGVVLIRR